jgi:FixJ family two-component response regulator
MPETLVISIVDDDSSLRQAIMGLVRSMGFAAEAFRSAEEFVSSGGFRRTSCLIADMRMPGMSGLELRHHLLAAGSPVPTILITAFPDERDRARAKAAGVLCYLAKPFAETELLGCIQLAFSGPGVTSGNPNH